MRISPTLGSFVEKDFVSAPSSFIKKSFLFDLHALLFIHANPLTNPTTSPKTRGCFRNNFYFIYNSVYFTNGTRVLNKYKLSEFFRSKFTKDGTIFSKYASKARIGFGKLTWYWVFRLMASNRFLFNFKEYRNKLSVCKFSFYEMALKSYEKNYNNWLFFYNKSSEDLNKASLKTKNRIIFKNYTKRKPMADFNPLVDMLSDDKISLNNFRKIYRRMPFVLKRQVRKKKRKTKLRSAPRIRKFRQDSEVTREAANKYRDYWLPFIFKKNIFVYRGMKYWEKYAKRSLWRLRAAKSDYYATASLSFTRLNLLNSKFLGETKSSILRDYTSTTGSLKKNSYLNFKYKFPKNSVELLFGYDYYSTFPTKDHTNFNSDSLLLKKKHIKYADSKTVTNSIADYSISNKNNFFIYKKYDKECSEKKIILKSVKNQNNLKFNSTKFFFNKPLRSSKLSNNFGIGPNFVNRISSKNLNKVKVLLKKSFFKKDLYLARNIRLLFYYKSKSVLTNFLFKSNLRYQNYRNTLNRVRLDSLISNSFLNSMLSFDTLRLASTIKKNRLRLLKQSLLFKLFGKITTLDSKINNKKFKKSLKKKFLFYRQNSINSFIDNTPNSDVSNRIPVKKKISVRQNFKRYVGGLRKKHFYKNFKNKREGSKKRPSLVRAILIERLKKNRKSIKFSKVFLGKKLRVLPLPWNKVKDSLGEVVTKFSIKKTLYSHRKYFIGYRGRFSYRALNTKLAFRPNTSIVFSKLSNFANPNTAKSLIDKKSHLIKLKRLSKSNVVKLLPTNLYFGNFANSLKIATSPQQYSVNFKNPNDSYSKGALTSNNFDNSKASLLTLKKKRILANVQFLYKVKPRFLSNKFDRLFNTDVTNVVRKRVKGVDIKNAFNFSSEKSIAVVKLHKAAKSSIFAKNTMLWLKRTKLGFFKNKNFKKMPTPSTISIPYFLFFLKNRRHPDAANSTPTPVRSNRNKLFFRKILNPEWRFNFSKRLRYSLLRRPTPRRVWKSVDFDNGSIKRLTLPVLRVGLPDSSVRVYSEGRAFFKFSKKVKYFNGLEKNALNYNLFRNSANSGWFFYSKGYGFKDSVGLGTKLNKIRYFKRNYRISNSKSKFVFGFFKKIIFKKRKLLLKKIYSKKLEKQVNSSGFRFKKTTKKLSILPNIFQTNNLVVSNAYTDSMLKNINNLENLESTHNGNPLFNFFKKIKLSGSYTFLIYKKNLISRNIASFRFRLSDEIVNYFNLSTGLSKILLRNVKIQNAFNTLEFFKTADSVWKSKTLLRFERSRTLKRLLNYKLTSFFHFFTNTETIYYKNAILNFKKTLRKYGRVSGGSVYLKQPIKYGELPVWRAQYMSSNMATVLKIKEPFRYNFTKHSFKKQQQVYVKSRLNKMVRSALRKNIKFLLKKRFKWVRLVKRRFKKFGWAWKKKYKTSKTIFRDIRRKLWAKSMRNFNFRISEKPYDFIGKRLVRRLKKRKFKKKLMFWNQKRFLLYDSDWGMFGYFWSKVDVAYNKFVQEFRRKAFKFPRRLKPRIFYKKSPAVFWKLKNPHYWRKHRQFAKRFYPKFWYKVFRRKFPLKRHRADWSFKLAKVHLLQIRHDNKRISTFYDSSSVYFKNLSIGVKPKRHRKYVQYKKKFKMQYVDRDLEIFEFELDPKFARKAKRRATPSFSTWKLASGFRKFKKKISLSSSWVFSPTTSAKMLAKLDKTKIDKVDSKLYNVFTKRRARLLTKKFDTYRVFLDLVKDKLADHSILKKQGFFHKFIYETRAVSDTTFDKNIGYFRSKAKYSVILRNCIYNQSLSRTSIVDSLVFETNSEYNLLSYKYKFLTTNQATLSFSREYGFRNYLKNILYINTSKYRNPSFLNGHQFYKLKHNGSVLGLVSDKRSNFTNKTSTLFRRFSSTGLKKLDFMSTKSSGGFQFNSDYSIFFKKNMWVLNSVVVSKVSSEFGSNI